MSQSRNLAARSPDVCAVKAPPVKLSRACKSGVLGEEEVTVTTQKDKEAIFTEEGRPRYTESIYFRFFL